MFFKLTTAFLTLGLLIGCARENERAGAPIRVTLKGSSDCLSEFGARLTDYANERLSSVQITQTWDCAAQAITDFQRLTVPDIPGGSYSPQGLRHFLQRYFLKGRPIDDALLQSVMDLKRVLVSGSSQRITRGELERMKALLAELRDISLDLKGVAGVIFMKRLVSSDSDTERAAVLLENAGRRLGRWIEANQQAYSYSQLTTLLEGLRGYNGQDDDGRVLGQIENAMKVLPAVKSVLVAGSDHGVSAQEWERTLVASTRGYSAFLTTYYSFDDLNTALLRRGLPQTFSRLADLLEGGVRARQNKKITAAEIGAVFEALEQVGWTAEGVKPGAMMAMWSWFTQRTLHGTSQAGAIGLAQIERLRKFSGDWDHLLDYSEGKKVAHTPEVLRFENTLKASPPISWDEENRMFFPRREAGEIWTPERKRHMVWPFVILDLLRKAYGNNQSQIMDESQVEVAVAEVLPLLQGFGWLLETEVSIGKRLVREANLFTQAADGDGLLSMGEAVRYLAFAASAYRSAELWLQRSLPVCGDKQAANCVRQLGFQDPFVLAALPRLQSQIDSPKYLMNYMRQAEETVLDAPPTDTYRVTDLTMVMVLFQFVEGFIQRYDSDQTESITLPEAENAFLVYQNILGDLLAPTGLPPEEVEVFFTFMMKYGDTPYTMFGGPIAYNHWKWHRKHWVFTADRRILMSILNQLSKF
ncbi:MAG: hypothetical protein KF799_13795 [Bdellovibrionales bacterium]|nr:hypothetical protein [Bdellovibrionales bacterium]